MKVASTLQQQQQQTHCWVFPWQLTQAVVPAGDFAVLLKAGMTVKQAIVYNLLSAMMAYIGMLIGTAVGQYANNITLWIFAVTAGMFLYVALVDMVRLPGLWVCWGAALHSVLGFSLHSHFIVTYSVLESLV